MPGPLVSVSWLLHHLLEPEVRVVDVRWYLADPDRGKAEYAVSHIPGALYLHLDEDLSAPKGDGRHPLPESERLAKVLGGAGIGNQHHVVAYDEGGGGVAARLWWMLGHVGHRAVSVLDGGLWAWRAAEFPITSAITTHRPEVFLVDERDDDTIGREELRVRAGSILLLDARDPERYEGLIEPVDPVAGHIPTAVSAPYSDNLSESRTFLSPEAIRARFVELGAAEADEVVVYCGSGVTACHHILAMEAVGLQGARLYPGSWSDWSKAGYPVATGPEPGEMSV
ncbi:MAG TPA: sulfurtransferase [Acidimicrobiia bacterium]